MKKILLDCVDILDFKRIPLSANERARMKKIYPYYGAQGIIDYVEDFIFDGEYILIAEDGENLRSLSKNIATWATGKFWVNNHAHILGYNGNSNLRFIYYFLSSMDLRRYVTGSAQPKLNQYNLANLEIDLPPLEVQRQIGNFLYSLDQKISLNKKINATLEDMAKTLYDYWFVQFDFPDENGKPYKSSGGKMIFSPELQREIPEGWEVKRIKNLLNVVTGKEDANFSVPNGKYKFFTCSNEILNCEIPAFEGSAVLLAGNGDFNVKHYTGKFNAYQRTYVLIPSDKKYYAVLYIAVKKMLKTLNKNSNGSIVKFITKSDVENISVLDPNNDELLKKLNNVYELIEKNNLENDLRFFVADVDEWTSYFCGGIIQCFTNTRLGKKTTKII